MTRANSWNRKQQGGETDAVATEMAVATTWSAIRAGQRRPGQWQQQYDSFG